VYFSKFDEKKFYFCPVNYFPLLFETQYSANEDCFGEISSTDQGRRLNQLSN